MVGSLRVDDLGACDLAGLEDGFDDGFDEGFEDVFDGEGDFTPLLPHVFKNLYMGLVVSMLLIFADRESRER